MTTTRPTKSQAFRDLVDAIQRSVEPREVQVFVNAYLRAPRGDFDLNKVMASKNVTARQYLEQLAAMSDIPQLARWFDRVPKKRNLLRPSGPVYGWTAGRRDSIQGLRRHQWYMHNIKARRNSAWLERFMVRHALRAPALPLRARRTPLYRGMMLKPWQISDMSKTLEWKDKGFMAFTRSATASACHTCNSDNDDNRDSGDNSSHPRDKKHFVMFQLRLDDVARGTPWIWYTDENAAPGLPHSYPDQREVLLPPGTLHIKRLFVTEREATFTPRYYSAPMVFHADVTFTPAPEFAPKPRRKGTRESNTDILWDIFADDAAPAKKRARNKTATNNQATKMKRGLSWPAWLRPS